MRKGPRVRSQEFFRKAGFYLDRGTIEAIERLRRLHRVSKSSAIIVAVDSFMALPHAARQDVVDACGARLRRQIEPDEISSESDTPEAP